MKDEIKLPFKEGQYFEFENAGEKVYWKIVGVFEKANFLVLDNMGKPEKLYIDKSIQRIKDGLVTVVSEDEIVEYCSKCGGVIGGVGIHKCICK